MSEQEMEARTKWRALIAERVESGRSITSFCLARGLSEGRFYKWKKRLREEPAQDFVPVEVVPEPEAGRPTPEMRGAAIEVRLRRGRSLMVEPGFDARHLRALLAVLEA